LIQKLKDRLSSWKSKNITFGGRLVLLNSVLSNLPVYCLSFYRAPKKVIAEIRSVQRNFLWGGSDTQKKIAWVKWETVCMPKSEGGLGVKDVEKFNISLLSKWRWRLLVEQDSLWFKVMRAKYGHWEWSGVVRDCHGMLNSNYPSGWWRELWRLDKEGDLQREWWSSNIIKRVGDGGKTIFWGDPWVGGSCLKDKFPRLFALSNKKYSTIAEVRTWVNERWEWCLNWRRELFEWEKGLLQSLNSIIAGSVGDETLEDSWWWLPNSAG